MAHNKTTLLTRVIIQFFLLMVVILYPLKAMRPQLLFCILLLFLQTPGTVFSQVQKELVLRSHPRLLVQQKDLSRIRRNINHPDFVLALEALAQQKLFVTDGTATNGAPDERIRQKMEAYALDYLLFGRKADGDTALHLALQYLPSIKTASGYWNNIYAYEAVFGTAMVYDWCYPLLMKAQKDTIIRHIKRVLSLTEYGYPVTKERSYFSGHYGEHGPTAFLAAGLAVYDEDKDLFDFAYAEQRDFFAPLRNAWSKAGTHHQGPQYMHTRYSQEMVQAFILEKAGLPLYDKSITSLALRAPYQSIPQKGGIDAMPEGDLHASWDWPKLFYVPAAHLSGDPFLQDLSRRHLKDNLYQSARMFIYHNPAIKTKRVEALPLSRFFPSPSGIMMARTAWDLDSAGFGSNAVVVQMNMKEYHARNHDHLDIGHFSIYYKGHLAMDAGGYQGPAPGVRYADMEYGAAHHRNFYQRTVAHNSLLIYDPNEPIPLDRGTEAREGGQFPFTNHEWKTTAEMLAAGKSAQVLAHDIAPGLAPDYTYLKGDMTAAYNVPDNISKTYPDKAKKVRRSFVFLNHHNGKIPATLIVLDKVVSNNPAFKKTWLLHTENEPQIGDNIILAKRTDSGRNGMLHTTVLLPEKSSQVIEKIGGPGKEFWVDGKAWGAQSFPDIGQWRVELSPKEKALADNFLTVLQVMDAEPSPPPMKVEKAFSPDSSFVAVAVGDRIVVKNAGIDQSAGPISFIVGDKQKTYKVLVTDLMPGIWQVQTPSGSKKVVVKKDKGTTYCTSKGGFFSLAYVSSR